MALVSKIEDSVAMTCAFRPTCQAIRNGVLGSGSKGSVEMALKLASHPDKQCGVCGGFADGVRLPSRVQCLFLRLL